MARACDWSEWLGGGESAASWGMPAGSRASLHTIITPLVLRSVPAAAPQESRSRLLDFADAAPLDAAYPDLDPPTAALVETLLDRGADATLSKPRPR